MKIQHIVYSMAMYLIQIVDMAHIFKATIDIRG